VGRDTTKKWAYIFSDYLSAGANPEKGTPRQFTIDDVRVFAYILMYWEDDPDMEYSN
jgi:endo-1,4-beta-D-glucanase Y